MYQPSYRIVGGMLEGNGIAISVIGSQ